VKSKLIKKGFLSLLITQFFGAINDNILKGVLIYMVISGIWKDALGSGGQGLVSMCFTIPFIALSGYAGQVADRNSKRSVAVWVKVVEIPIALIALIGFQTGNLWITLSSLIALTCQSAYFGPAKYGMIPELVESRDLSRANGTINMMTNLAVILGTLLAGILADLYSPLPDESGMTAEAMPWLPGTVMLIVAVCGLIAVVYLPRLAPGSKDGYFNFNPLAAYVKTFRDIARTPLMMIMFAWGYFYFLAGLALLIIPEYTEVLESYQVSRTEASALLGVMGIAIGVGSALAGLISGHAIKPILIPIGAVGLTVFFVLLGVVPPALPDIAPMWRVVFSSISAFIFGAGVFAGFYIIPLQSLIQYLSPDEERGQILGTANGLSFAFLSISNAIFVLIRDSFGEHPERIFIVSGGLMLVGAGFFVWRMKVRNFSFAQVS